MCTSVLVCHGDDRANLGYASKNQLEDKPKDCKPATYYITNDGKYAIDADFVDIENLDNIDLETVPKIELKSSN